MELNGAPLGHGATDGDLARELQRLGRPVTLGFLVGAGAARSSSRTAPEARPFAGAVRAGRAAAAADASSDEAETTVAAVSLGDRYRDPR